MPSSSFRTYARRGCLSTVVVALLCVGVLVGLGWQAFGKGARGARLKKMEASAQWTGSGFENPQPLWNDMTGSVAEVLGASDYASPHQPLPVVRPDPALYTTAPASGLRVTWLGHSTTLIELDGHVVLTDPIWGQRTSPYTFLGPRRWVQPPLALQDLPPLDAILISHDHYDHLDMPTVLDMLRMDAPFVVPLGVGAHLEYWGVPKARIVEVGWWEEVAFGNLKVACTPARHASGRQLLDQNDTLWAGYALIGPEHRVYFSGDTGMFPDLAKIGTTYGPFDLTMVEVGAYNRAWPDWHMGPEQAIEAHTMLRGERFLPIHWGLFELAPHGWTEPIERAVVAARAKGVPILTPHIGEAIEPARDSTSPWWPAVPWESAAEHPIKATGL